jgi:Domain of unknown function (DUF4351)
VCASSTDVSCDWINSVVKMKAQPDRVNLTLKLLRVKFGELSEGLTDCISELSVDQLEALAEASIDWRRVDELMEWLEAIG